ncbi:MAG: serine/threonine-protein kinase [Pirellulales bacterium]
MSEPDKKKPLDETIQLTNQNTERLDHGQRSSGSSADEITMPPQETDSGKKNEGLSSQFSLNQSASLQEQSGDQQTLAHDSSPFRMPTAASNAGKKFGDYCIESEIARGGMGVVYRAHQLSLNRPVAIKMILSGNLAGADDVRRFYVEAEAAAKLEHPNIVPIYEIGQLDGQHFFSMGFVDGGSLDRLISENTLPAKTAVQLMILVCDAIQFAHDHGIVHRDLKPANILLAKSNLSKGGTSNSTARANSSVIRSTTNTSSTGVELEWIPKVSDFGLAKQLNSRSELTGTGQILGTPSYMPPEQAEGSNESVGPLSDVYSLGAILYRTLTGRPPFQSSSPMETILQLLNQDPVAPRSLNPSIPIELETICVKCLQKEPTKRYGSAQELSEDLGRWLRGDPILARPMSVAEKSWRWIRKHPTFVGSTAVVAVAIASVMIILAKSNKSLAIERDAAVKARQEADKQQGLAQSRLTRAIESIDKTTARVVSKRWSMDPTLQDERRLMLENAIQFYNGLIEDASDTEQVRFQAVKAYDQVAGAKFLLNDLPGAIEACRRSLDLSKQLNTDFPERHEYQAKYASTLSLSGSITAFKGDLDNGLKQMFESVELCRKVADANPSIRKYQVVALDAMSHYAYFVLSSVVKVRDSGEKLIPDILMRAEQLEKNPEVTSLEQVAIAFGFNVCGAYDLNLGQAAEAKKYFERSRLIVRGIKDLESLDARHADGYYHVWAIACTNLGTCCMYEQPPQIEEGLQFVEEGIQPLETLIQIHPSSFVYKMQMMQALRTKIGGLTMLGKADAVRDANDQMKKLTERLIQENPESPWVVAMQTPQQTIALVDRIRTGDLKDFEAEVTKLLSRTSPNTRAAILYNIMCAYSQATRVTTDDSVKARYESEIQRLMDELKQLDYFENDAIFQHAQNDEDLAPIKDKIDWSALRKKSS